MGAKALVAAGMRWRIGDGRSVDIWKDKWLPNSIRGKPLSKRPANCSLSRVHELIDHPRNCWKEMVVKHLFLPHEADQILQIPVNAHTSRDKLIWAREKSGLFTVKSAYKLAFAVRREVTARDESSKDREEHSKMWKMVWGLPIKPKLKHFLWRVLHNWLAIGSVVKERWMNVDDTCRRCELAKETREHLFFHCTDSALVWKVAPLSWIGIHKLTASFEDWWKIVCLANK